MGWNLHINTHFDGNEVLGYSIPFFYMPGHWKHFCYVVFVAVADCLFYKMMYSGSRFVDFIL